MRVLRKIKQAIKHIIKKVYVFCKKFDTSIDVRELFMSENSPSGFKRYDIVVRYLFIEEFFGINHQGYALYEKMQRKRAGENYNPDCPEEFKKTILSYEKEGYRSESKISLGTNLQLIDGSHRIAAGLYFKCYNIEATVTPIRTEYDYSIEWFIANDFSDAEIRTIKDKYLELEKMCNQEFECVIWPPMADFFEQATEDLKKLCEVLHYKDYDFTRPQFEFFIKGVYAVDDIEPWKIEKKIENMIGNDRQDTFKVRVVDLSMSCPKFRLKQTSHRTLSQRGEKIKAVIRTKYKDKVDHYYYDNVMHIADNFYQSRHIKLLKDARLDISEYFSNIKDEEYVVTKLDVPYMPKDFPHNVPLGKDIDILCRPASLERLALAAEDYCRVHAGPYRCYRQVKSKEHVQVRLELNGKTIFIWDITTKEEGLREVFTEEAVKRFLLVNGVKVLSPEFEYIYRMAIIRRKTRDYHILYLEQHKEDYNPELEKRYIEIK